MYVDKEQYRTDIASGGTDVKEVSDFEQIQDGAYTVYVNNKSIKDLTVDAQYALINSDTHTADDTKAFYAAGSYNLSPFTIETQTYQTDNGNAVNSKGSAYGVNLLGNFDKLSLGVAYSIVDKDANIINGIGNGADYLYTGTWIYGGIYDADTDAYKLSAGYKITTDLSFDLNYGAWKTGTNPTASETDFITTYTFNENFSTKFVLATYDNLADESYRTRLYASYKF